MSDISIAAITSENIPAIWSRVEKLLQKVADVSHGELTLDIIRAELMSGKCLLVTVSRGSDIVAVNTLEIHTFKTGIKALYIPITGGDELDEWLGEFLEKVKSIARDYGCTEIRGKAVRNGWIRKLKPYGWEPVHTVIHCPVEYDNEQVGEG